MAKKAALRKPAKPRRPAVKADRFARLVRMLEHLGGAPRTRAVLLRWLRLDMRAFYRDLTLLRSVGIRVRLVEGRYVLTEPVDTVLPRLPFPDPHLTLGEVQELARGRGTGARQLAEQLALLVP
jgi:hypothetical protein